MKILPLVFLFLFVGLSMCVVENISEDEDRELERQVKMMNKPPVKTFVTKEGGIIDCIDIDEQPSLELYVLKNHKVQKEPKLHLSSFGRNFSHITSIQYGLREPCPMGTVPISRVTKKDLISAKALPRMPSSTALRRNAVQSGQHLVHLREESLDEIKYGAFARASIYNVTVARDQFSQHNIWIESGPPDQASMIVVGWMVAPQLYGDTLSRLFTYWTGNGYRNGCYNLLCPGFVVVDRKVPIDLPLPASTYGGAQQELPIQVERDRATGNWWLIVGVPPTKIGYWPKELFPLLQDGSQYVAWGGIGGAGSDGICPPMGSGHKPDGDIAHATYFRELKWINKYGQLYNPTEEVSRNVDKSNVYDLQYYRGSLGRSFGYWCGYGGPGGYCRG